MAFRSTAKEWGSVARAFHWGMLLLFIAIVLVGYYMADLPLGLAKLKIYALHTSVGLTLLGLAVLRLAWRLGERRPTLPPMPAWQAKAAAATHGLLYVLMFAMPLSGWIYNSASHFPLQWFRIVNLPALVGESKPLAALAKEAHEVGALVLIAVVLLHAAAALKHHFVDKDATLRLMLPSKGGPR
jgi:cytochrome b561